MITCPRCQQSLPDWAQSCQFCGSDTKAVARPAPAEKKRYKNFETPQWVWVCYYLIAAWWVLGGIFDVMNAFYLFGKPPKELLGSDGEMGPNIVGIIAGSITALFGIGLAFRIEVIRGIVNFAAGAKLLLGLLGIAGTIMGMTVSGALAIPLVFLHVINVITAGGLIFLIGETDSRAHV